MIIGKNTKWEENSDLTYNGSEDSSKSELQKWSKPNRQKQQTAEPIWSHQWENGVGMRGSGTSNDWNEASIYRLWEWETETMQQATLSLPVKWWRGEGENKHVKAQQAFHEKTQSECKLHKISCLAIIIHTLNARKPGKDPVSEPTHTNSRLGRGGGGGGTCSKHYNKKATRRVWKKASWKLNHSHNTS